MAHDSKTQSPQSILRTSTRPSSSKLNPAAQVFTPRSRLSRQNAGMQVPVVGKAREVIEEEDIGCPLCDEGLWCPMCGKEDKIDPTPITSGVTTLSQAAAASHGAVASEGKQSEQDQDFPPGSWPAVKQRIEKWLMDADGMPGAQ